MSEIALRRATDRGVAALRAGDGRSALAALSEVETAGRATSQLRLLIARAALMAGDIAAGQTALDRILATDPANLQALLLRGDLYVKAGEDRAAASWYEAALAHARRLGPLAPDLAAEVARAELAAAAIADRFRGHMEAMLRGRGVDAAAAGARFAEALAILSGEAEVQLQRPTSFYYPRLAQIPFYEREAFDWIRTLEAETDAIREELSMLLDHDAPAYVEAEHSRPAKRHALLNDTRWAAYHLIRNGVPVADHADRCPRTMAALARTPMPRIAGRSPMALFSVLRAGTHIPPHCGMLNTRLICHLPVIVPAGCRLRVGNETRTVEAGRAMLFDDSIEHEAWNDSTELRIVLLFEVWRPELDEAERVALTALFEAIGTYAGPTEDQGGA